MLIQAPQRARSIYYNYKGTQSIVLKTVVNAKYQFTLVDISDVGRQSDGGVFSAPDLGFPMNSGKRPIQDARKS